ncbi:MAG: F0F1 ATP synthase subunit A [Mycobacteriales bacterium]
MTTEAADIQVGNHLSTVLGLHADTIWSTVLAGLIVIIAGVLIARRATSGVPRGPQLLWETIVGGVEDQVESSLGIRTAPFVVPLGVALFSFILVANWLEIIPAHGALPSPTADINLPLALALLVIVWVHAWGAHRIGARKYWSHFFNPPDRPFVLRPLAVLEEITKPITLSLRLFGNLLSGGIMIELIGLFPAYISWGPNIVWKLFDMFIGLIQAFIFALLTILYFNLADIGAAEHDPASAAAPERSDQAESESEPSTPEPSRA